MTFNQTRRRFLQALGATALPSIALPGFVQAANGTPMPSGHVLVLVELAGGNDGLNTVVPTRDPAYRALRPEIGVSHRETLRLDPDTGLHPSMIDIAALWEHGNLQIIEGVGYPDPNRSHFRSIEIWNSGKGSDSDTRQGWVSSSFEGGSTLDADGLVLGGDMGPLRGPGRFSSMREEWAFLEGQESLQGTHAVRPKSVQSPLDHVLATYESAQITGDAIRRRLETSPARRFPFPDTDLGQQLRTATRLLEAGVDVAVLKVVQDGYDTHEGQVDAHAELLEELSQALGAFASALRQIGLWDRVTAVTYSEFGRTARENASLGTDHGTAAPVFVLGGQVHGGLSGARPDLEALVDDDLVHTTDYRRVYDGILDGLWGIDPYFSTEAPLKLLK